MFTMVQNSHNYKNFFTEHYFLRDRFSFSAYLPNYFQKFHSEQNYSQHYNDHFIFLVPINICPFFFGQTINLFNQFTMFI